MDIIAINEAINDLEKDDTTANNVAELSALYIVREYLMPKVSRKSNAVENELNDILPSYLKYLDIKRKYQLGQTAEGEVIKGIKSVCKESQEFIGVLYSSTDMGKERRCIKDTLEKLNEKYQ